MPRLISMDPACAELVHATGRRWRYRLHSATPLDWPRLDAALREVDADGLLHAHARRRGVHLVEAARDHRAPDVVVTELERLPQGETFERIGDVVRALGYPTETGPGPGASEPAQDS